MSRILIVEDDPAILRGLTDNLKLESYEVLTATDGEAGYRLIGERKPDLIILDLMLGVVEADLLETGPDLLALGEQRISDIEKLEWLRVRRSFEDWLRHADEIEFLRHTRVHEVQGRFSLELGSLIH